MSLLTSTDRFDALVTKDKRYEPEAYTFVYEALDWSLKKILRSNSALEQHVSVRDLLEGIRQSAINQFGPFAHMVFERWGVRCTDDWGEIVFNLIEYDLLGKQESDRKEDFSHRFEFSKAFNLEPEFRYDKYNDKWMVSYKSDAPNQGLQSRN